MTICTETGDAPSAKGVIVKVVGLPAGFLTVSIELIDVVSIIDIPTIWSVPVALPTTVFSIAAPFKVNSNCPASVTETWNNIW